MLPNSSLSIYQVYNEWMCPLVTSIQTPLVDYELGGVNISDTSAGLSHQMWECSLNNQNKIILTPEHSASIEIITVPDNITKLTFAFDQNMKVCIAYSVQNSTFLYWFDTILSDYTITEFVGCTSPALTLDERRDEYISNSDVVFAYVRDNKLCYRLQRDRYTVEYILVENFNGKVIAIGTNIDYRLQFSIMYNSYLL